MSFLASYGVPDTAVRTKKKAVDSSTLFSPKAIQSWLDASMPSATTATAPAPSPDPNIVLPSVDYEKLLLADPNYIAWQTSSQKNQAQAAAQRKAALRALIIQFGGMGGDVKDTYGDLSSADYQAAANNPYSVEAQLQRQYDLSKTALERSLSARGALHSGDLGYGLGQLDTQHGQSEYDAGLAFSQQFKNAINAYLGVLSSNESSRVDAIKAAYQDIYSNPAYANSGGTATLVSNWQAAYGVPVYQAADGSLYTADGKPYGG